MCLNLTVSSETSSQQILFCPEFKSSSRSCEQISAESQRELQLSGGFSSEAYRHQPLRLVVLKVLITPRLIKVQPHGFRKHSCKLTGTDVP